MAETKRLHTHIHTVHHTVHRYRSVQRRLGSSPGAACHLYISASEWSHEKKGWPIFTLRQEAVWHKLSPAGVLTLANRKTRALIITIPEPGPAALKQLSHLMVSSGHLRSPFCAMQRGNHLTDQPRETVDCDRETNQYSWSRKPQNPKHVIVRCENSRQKRASWCEKNSLRDIWEKSVKPTCMIQSSYVRQIFTSCNLRVLCMLPICFCTSCTLHA